jgi:hypothetical protein
MAAEPKLYTRLTRDASGVGTYSSLWLAKDHLMIVTMTGVSESYSRVDLRDVKAFFLTPSHRRTLWALPWGVMAFIALLAVLSNLAPGDRLYTSPVFLGLGLVGLAWNHFLGAGCKAYVVTGVQTAQMSSLVRMPKARKVLARLEGLIATAQADLVNAPPAAPDRPPTIV